MEYLNKGYIDAFGRVWSDREVDYVNHKIDFLNECERNFPQMVETAKIILANAMLNPNPRVLSMEAV